MADRSFGAGDLICAIELLLLLLVVVGDAGRAVLACSPCHLHIHHPGSAASSLSAYLVSSGRSSFSTHCWEQYIKRRHAADAVVDALL